MPEDIAALSNPYDALWDPKYKGKTAVIDDWHTAMAMVLLRNGKTDINTAKPDDLKLIRDQLTGLAAARRRPKVTITMYNDLPAGQLGLCQMWSGDVVNAQYYLPKGTGPDVLRYWFPPDGKGMVDNDLMVVLQGRQEPGARAPVPQPHARHRRSRCRTSPTSATSRRSARSNPTTLVADGFIPTNLRVGGRASRSTSTSATACSSSTAANDAAWHKIWQAFKAGG